MKALSELFHNIGHAASVALHRIWEGLPSFLIAALVMLVGLALARGLRWIVNRMGAVARLDQMARKVGIGDALQRIGLRSIPYALGILVYWLVLLGALLGAASALELEEFIMGLQRVFAYVPTLLASLAVFLVGLWMADKARFVVGSFSENVGITGGKVIGRILFVIIMLFLSITALNVAGVDTTLITSNILIVVGSLFVAFSIAYGFAAREILTNILSSYYGRDRFKPGMRIRMGNDEGVIERIDSISITLRTADKLVLLPTKQLVSERIEVLDNSTE
ncbi:MAG: hypothetical protein WAU70_01995 [Flavobacteriales bacterium]